MRYVILVLFTVLCFFSNSNIKAAAQNHTKIFGGTEDDLDQKPEQINNLDTSKITIGPININGYFHFFFSSTSQEEIYNIKDANGGMENEGALNFLYTNEIDNENKFSINFNIKKKFSNKIRFRTSFKYQNENFGDLELSNYSRIQDNLMVNTYWIKAGSNGAWDRSINTGLSILNDNRDTSLINKILTGYDTSETFGGDVDSANLAYYIKPLECLTLGISYSPKTYTGRVENDFFNYKNIIKAGAIYNYDLNDDSNIKLSILGEHGTPAQNPHNIKIQSNLSDLNAINFGGLIKYMNLSIAGTIGIWGESGMYKNIPINTTPEYTTPKDTHYFDIAASYNINEKPL